MRYKGLLFKNRKFDFKKLKNFGFEFKNNEYFYKTNIYNDLFCLNIKILSDGLIDTKVTEIASSEEFNLVYIKNAEGEFIGKIKEEFNSVLEKIQKNCTIYTAFESEYANLIIKYIKDKYNDEAEFLWDKLPNACIFRKKDASKKGKWYAVIMNVAKNKIISNGNDDLVDIIDLKNKPEIIEKLIDDKKYFKGYHMNKKHWFTICLDKSVDIKEIQKRIDESYNLL